MLRKRYDGCGMGVNCPTNAGATSSGPTKRGGLAQGRAGDPLHSVQRMPVAGTTEGISTVLDGSAAQSPGEGESPKVRLVERAPHHSRCFASAFFYQERRPYDASDL